MDVVVVKVTFIVAVVMTDVVVITVVVYPAARLDEDDVEPA